MKNTFKNHVYICIDVSGSMGNTIDSAVKVFNNQIEFLRKSSIAFEQETRVSFYKFNSDVTCVISDVDVARPMTLEKMVASGQTALMDAVDLAIEDSKLISQKYGDHAFVLYLITDGEENASRINSSVFKSRINSLPDNFSVIGFVPNLNGKTWLKNLGFSEGNLEIWDTTAKGIEEVGKKMEAATTSFFQGRSRGIRSSNTMLSDLKDVTSKNVTKVLDEVKKFDLIINEKTQAVEIKPLYESKFKGIYTKGTGYYELVKNEHVQANKEIAIQNKKTGKVYSGDNARKLLGLPNTEVKVVPGDYGEWIVYIQSNALNRKIIPKQRLLVIK